MKKHIIATAGTVVSTGLYVQQAQANTVTNGAKVTLPNNSDKLVLLQGEKRTISSSNPILQEAERIVKTSSKSGVSKSSSSTGASQSDVNKINSTIDSIVGKNGVAISDDIKVLTPETRDDFEQNKDKIRQLLNEYQLVRTSLNTQAANYYEVSGQLPSETETTVTYNSYAELAKALEDKLSELRNLEKQNKESIERSAQATATNSYLEKAVVDANKQISSAQRINTGALAGVRGQYDQMNRYAQDSAKLGVVKSTRKGDKSGVIVNTTGVNGTSLANSTVNNTEIKTTRVESIEEKNAKLQEILNRMSQEQVNNAQKTRDAEAQVRLSKVNIDDINTWLQEEQTYADNIENEIEKNLTAKHKMDAYKSESERKLAEIEAYINSGQAKGSPQALQRLIDEITKARKALAESNVTTHVGDEIKGAEDVDFGLIDRPTSEIDVIQNSTTQDVRNRVGVALEKLREDNRKAEAHIQPTIERNNQSIDKFIEDVRRGGSGAQIDETFLNSRQIYREGTQAYKDMIHKALEADGEKMTDQISTIGAGLRRVDRYPDGSYVSASDLASRIYRQQAEERGIVGTGSIMMPTNNINTHLTTSQSLFADSKTFPGGSQGVINKLRDVLRYNHPGVINSGVIQATQDQMINIYGNDKVWTVVSHQDEIQFQLSDSFLYADADGTPQTTDTLITVGIRDKNGNRLSINRSGGSIGDPDAALFVYSFAVNPNNGQLIVSTGYITYYKGTGGVVDTNDGNHTVEGGDDGLLMNRPSHSDLMFDLMGNGVASVDGNRIEYRNPAPSTPAPTPPAVAYPIYNQIQNYYATNNYATNNTYGNYSSYVNKTVQPVNYVRYPKVINDTDKLINVSNDSKSNGFYIQAADRQARTSQLGISNKITINVSKAAFMYAESAPLFVTEIDQGQNISVPGSQETIIYGHSLNSNGTINSGNTNSNHNQNVMDNESLMLYSKNGLLDTEFTITDPLGNTKHIITNLFTPYGIKGAPSMNLGVTNADIETFTLGDPSARARSEGKINLSSTIEYLTTGDTTGEKLRVKNEKITVELPKYKYEVTERIVSSNNSFIIRKIPGENKITSAYNSLVVKRLNSDKINAAYNTFVIRKLNGDGKINAAYNTFVIKRKLANAIKDKLQDTNLVVKELPKSESTQPIYTSTPKRQISVYVEPAIEQVTQQALKDWQYALGTKVDLSINYTNDMSKAQLVVLDADNQTTRLGDGFKTIGVEDDAQYEMGQYAGTTNYHRIGVDLTPADNDKFNRSGSLQSTKQLAESTEVIQLNTENLKSYKDQLITMRHELGHIFGLDHDESDPLMTSWYSNNPLMTGEIVKETAEKAAKYILRRFTA